MIRPREFVEAPPVSPLPFGLLSVALVLDDLTGHRQFGIAYEPNGCGTVHDSVAACQDLPNFGTLTVTGSTARVVTLHQASAPGVTYQISWGDGVTTAGSSVNNVTHTYTADGAKTITVTDEEGLGYVASATVTITNGQALASTDLHPGFSKVVQDGFTLVEADAVNLYSLHRCRLVGDTGNADRAREAHRLGEPRAIERILARRLSAASAVNLTPAGGATNLVDAFAALEDYTSQVYGGTPVVHIPRGVGTVAATQGIIGREGNRLETKQGSLVASGGGYGHLRGPAGEVAVAGTAWIYATGQVMVRRAPQIEVGPVMSRTPATNDALYLGERPVVAAWECVTAAVLVRTPYGVPTEAGFGQ